MNLSLDTCKQILSAFDLGKASELAYISKGFANINYKVKTDQRTILLKNHLEKTIEEIDYEMRVLHWLQQHNFPAAYAIPNRQGDYIQETEIGTVVLYEFVEGDEPEKTPQSAAAIGRAVAQLNQLSGWETLQRPNPAGWKLCESLYQELDQLPDIYEGFKSYFREQTDYLRPFLQKPLPIGLIHADIFTDNTLFKDDQLIAILDFETTCTDYLLIDVVMSITGFCFPNNRLDMQLFKSFWGAYQEIRPLNPTELSLLPQYLQLAPHAMLSWHVKFLLTHDYKKEKRIQRVQELADRTQHLRKIEPSIRKMDDLR